MRIDPNRLMRLAVLINQRSFRSAADKLALTQPALSQSIAQLEDEVGVQLITRSARGIEPTIYGEALYGHAKAIDRELTQAAQKIRNLVTGSAGYLLVGATTGGGIHLAAHALCELKTKQADGNVRIVEEVLVEPLFARLLDRTIDVVICQRQNDFDLKSVRAIKLFNTRKMLCVRKGHPLEHSQDLTALAQYPFVCPPDEMGVLSDIKSIFENNGVAPPGDIIESNSVALAKEVILNSNAFAIFSDISIWKERSSGDLVTREVPGGLTAWHYLVTRPEYTPTELVKAFVGEILAVCKTWNVEVHEDAQQFHRYGR